MDVSAIGPMIQSTESPRIAPSPRPETPGADAPGKAEEGGTLRFADLLQQVVASEKAADQATRDYATGANQNIHETMVNLQMADIRFSLMVTVRNKLLDAYREVMRMS